MKDLTIQLEGKPDTDGADATAAAVQIRTGWFLLRALCLDFDGIVLKGSGQLKKKLNLRTATIVKIKKLMKYVVALLKMVYSWL